MSRFLLDVLSDILLLLPVASILSSIFLWRVYRSDTARPRSWLLLLLAMGSTIVTISSIGIAIIAVIRLNGQSIGETGGVVLGLVLFILELIPIWYAYTIWRVRKGQRPTPRIPFMKVSKED